MNKDMFMHSLLLLFGVLISAVSQVLLKKEALKEHTSFIGEYLNIRVILAYSIFFVSTFLSILAYKGIPLSMGPVLEATGYIYVTVFGVSIFKERINAKKMLALALIICGIVVYSVLG